jgi:glutamate--cysteine ligase
VGIKNNYNGSLIDRYQLVTVDDLVTGLEKESLRVTPFGKISSLPHSKEYGAALTNPYITTDYSEALLELITPPEGSAHKTIQSLIETHAFVYQNIGDELLWVCSMPPAIANSNEIPIARYGTSNVGQMKYKYRQGLAYRYGRRMQSIAGIHFNFSLSTEAWQKWYKEDQKKDQSLQSFIDEKYLGLIRNYFRQSWLLLQLFGASPAIDNTFTNKIPDDLRQFDKNSWVGDYATSLRMSNIGYVNHAQAQLNVCYNSLTEYVRGLRAATSTVEPMYLDIGIKDEQGFYKQLNANILQIEAEYYSPIRPKRKSRRDERPLTALEKSGIDYVEVRALDLNPFEQVGISQTDLYFLDLFLLHCLFTESAPCSKQDCQEYRENKLRVAYHGRKPGLTLLTSGEEYLLTDWVEDIFAELAPLASWLDQQQNSHHFTDALNSKYQLLKNPEQLPSSRFLHLMEKEKISFLEAGLLFSEQQKERWKAFNLSEEKKNFYISCAQKSLQDQKEIEDSDKIPFDDYLVSYFSS